MDEKISESYRPTNTLFFLESEMQIFPIPTVMTSHVCLNNGCMTLFFISFSPALSDKIVTLRIELITTLYLLGKCCFKILFIIFFQGVSDTKSLKNIFCFTRAEVFTQTVPYAFPT